MIEYEITNASLEEKIKIQETWLKNELTGNVMNFEPKTGNGLSFIRELEQGLLIQAWDGLLHNDFRLFCRPVLEGAPIIYMINFFIMPDPCLIEAGRTSSGRLKKLNLRNSLVMSTNQSEFAFIVQKGTRLRDFDIIFSHEWLLQHFPTPKINELLSALTKEGQTAVLLGPISNDDFITVNEMLETVFKGEWDIVFLKSKVMTLLNDTLGNLLLEKKDEKETIATEHIPVMIAIEKKLRSVLHEKMPNLEVIAKEFFMSESTLKRQFKQTYGKAIYEYYLDKKMEKAKKMLADSELTIAQIAYALGYEKPSSFIKTFKKYFGVSPGSLRNDEIE